MPPKKKQPVPKKPAATTAHKPAPKVAAVKPGTAADVLGHAAVREEEKPGGAYQFAKGGQSKR